MLKCSVQSTLLRVSIGDRVPLGPVRFPAWPVEAILTLHLQHPHGIYKGLQITVGTLGQWERWKGRRGSQTPSDADLPTLVGQGRELGRRPAAKQGKIGENLCVFAVSTRNH